MDIGAALDDAGYDVVGPAASVEAALRLLAEPSGCDAAVVDVNLGSETSEPIARQLMNSGTPFIAVSGYSRQQLPAIFADARFLPKPLNSDQLLDELDRCLAVKALSHGEVAP